MTMDSLYEMKAMNSWYCGYGMIMFKFKFTIIAFQPESADMPS